MPTSMVPVPVSVGKSTGVEEVVAVPREGEDEGEGRDVPLPPPELLVGQEDTLGENEEEGEEAGDLDTVRVGVVVKEERPPPTPPPEDFEGSNGEGESVGPLPVGEGREEGETSCPTPPLPVTLGEVVGAAGEGEEEWEPPAAPASGMILGVRVGRRGDEVERRKGEGVELSDPAPPPPPPPSPRGAAPLDGEVEGVESGAPGVIEGAKGVEVGVPVLPPPTPPPSPRPP